MKVFSRTDDVMQQANVLKEKLQLKSDNVVIGFVGRLTKDKGIDLLFDAFNILTKQYAFLRMILAGPIVNENLFSESAMHQLYHDERIFYLGKMLDVRPVYEVMDVLVLPSFREGFPNVLIEASAMEVPLIASDIEGCRDAVMAGYTGELFEKGNLSALVAVLHKLISNSMLRKQYAANAREFVKDNFPNEKIWEGQLKLYKEILRD